MYKIVCVNVCGRVCVDCVQLCMALYVRVCVCVCVRACLCVRTVCMCVGGWGRDMKSDIKRDMKPVVVSCSVFILIGNLIRCRCGCVMFHLVGCGVRCGAWSSGIGWTWCTYWCMVLWDRLGVVYVVVHGPLGSVGRGVRCGAWSSGIGWMWCSSSQFDQ